MDNGNTPLAYQIPDAAKRIGVGRSMLYELAKEGRIALVKIGNRTIVTEAELRRFLSTAEAASRKVAA